MLLLAIIIVCVYQDWPENLDKTPRVSFVPSFTCGSLQDYGDQESSSESDEDENEDSQYAGDWNDYKWRENECKEGSTGEENEDTDVDAEVEKPSDEKIYSKLPVVTLLGVSAESAEAIRRKLLEVNDVLVLVVPNGCCGMLTRVS